MTHFHEQGLAVHSISHPEPLPQLLHKVKHTLFVFHSNFRLPVLTLHDRELIALVSDLNAEFSGCALKNRVALCFCPTLIHMHVELLPPV